jgi:hypothetical protein
MFSFIHNYIYFFFNYELIVLVCFLLFLFFAIISEKGKIGSYLHEVSDETRRKYSRILVRRLELIQELENTLDRTVSRLRLITGTLLSLTEDTLTILVYTNKRLSKSFAVRKIRNRLDAVLLKTQYLSTQIKIYLTEELFVQKNYSLKTENSSTKLLIKQ